MKKKIPAFDTDQQAQEFVDTANLAEYDLSGGVPVQFEFEAKAAHINENHNPLIFLLAISFPKS